MRTFQKMKVGTFLNLYVKDCPILIFFWVKPSIDEIIINSSSGTVTGLTGQPMFLMSHFE